MRNFTFAFAIAATLAVFYPTAGLADQKIQSTNSIEPDYYPAVKQELARMGFSARCFDSKMLCTANASLDDKNQVEFTVQYSTVTDTVYIQIPKFIELPQGQNLDADTSLQLLSHNAEMVAAKFEWDKIKYAVRLSTVISTDSNFDRKAFRSQLKGMLKVAAELRSKLLIGDQNTK